MVQPFSFDCFTFLKGIYFLYMYFICYSQILHPQINQVKGIPPIGKANHNIVYVEYDISAKRIQKALQKIYFKNEHTRVDYRTTSRVIEVSSDHSHMSVNDTWE